MQHKLKPDDLRHYFFQYVSSYLATQLEVLVTQSFVNLRANSSYVVAVFGTNSQLLATWMLIKKRVLKFQTSSKNGIFLNF